MYSVCVYSVCVCVYSVCVCIVCVQCVCVCVSVHFTVHYFSMFRTNGVTPPPPPYGEADKAYLLSFRCL